MAVPTIILDDVFKKDRVYNIYMQLLLGLVSFEPISCILDYYEEHEIELPIIFPESTEEREALIMDYVLSHSGEKYISNFVLKSYKLVKTIEPSADDARVMKLLKNYIGATFVAKYMPNWIKLYNAMFADYNPIQNYDSTEEITRSGDDKVSMNTDTTETITRSGDDKVSMNTDTTETTSHSGDDKTSNNIDNKQTEKVSAYNSVTLVDNKEVSNSGLASNNYSKTDYNSEVETSKSGLASNNYSKTDYNSEVETSKSGLASNNYSKTDYNSKVKTTKYGNIGITSSQDMINQEIELRKHHFWDIVFQDFDNLFTSNLYFIKD